MYEGNIVASMACNSTPSSRRLGRLKFDFHTGRGAGPHAPYVVVAAPPADGGVQRGNVVHLERHLSPSIREGFESFLRIGPIETAEAAYRRVCGDARVVDGPCRHL